MKLFKTILSIFSVLVLSSVLFACVPIDDNHQSSNPPSTEIPTELKESRVEITAVPTGVTAYDGASVKIENTLLPLYGVYVNNSHTWSPNPSGRTLAGVGYFSLEGKAELTVTDENLTSCTVRPLSANVKANVADGKATFTIKSAGNYSVELNDDPERAIFLFVSDIKEEPDNQAEEDGTRQTKVIRFEKGLHTTANSPYIQNDTITLTSDTTVIIDDGAVVRARFVANNAENITLTGNGIIDGSAFIRNATTGEVKVPLDFNYCKNLKFKDFSVLDPAGWCVNWYFCTDSEIDGMKIITSRSNGDGISIQSCKRINVKNCFLRTWDDSLVVKNYPQWSNRNSEGSTEDIIFENCTIWTDLAQSMEIGYETVGKTLTRVRFNNITVLHNFHKPVISIHNANNADVSDVKYDTITVEDGSMGKGDANSNCQLIEFAVAFNGTWSTQHKETALGNINNVSVKNLTMLDGNAVTTVRIVGCKDTRTGYNSTTHYVTDVTLENLWLNGKKFKKNYPYITTNDYSSVEIKEGEAPITAPFKFSKTEEQLKNYADHATVIG